MGRKRDQFWEYAESLGNGRFKCVFCNLTFAGGATRIKYHLARAKGHAINICEQVPKEVQEEASLRIGEPNKKLKVASISNKDKEREISSTLMGASISNKDKEREISSTLMGASISNKDKGREISSTLISKDDMLSRVFEESKAESMVEILVDVFVEGLLAKLRSIVIEQHISFELGFKEGLIDLLISLAQIKPILNDAEKRQASDDFVRSWLEEELRPVAYDIDDVLDEFGYLILRQKVLNYPLPSNYIIKMADKIKIINKSLNRLKGDIARYDLRAEFVNSIPEISFNMEIDSFLDDSVIKVTETFPQSKLYNCWLIFKKRASANERLLTPDLEKIGQEIVKRCKGVAWAARFLGGIMYFIHDKDEWLSIQNYKNWDLLDNDNDGVFHILKLGYDHLRTPSLKRCFAYCAIFPKDYAMKKDEVIQYWMAEGFLEPCKEGNTVMEDIGNTYFNILLATSFFQNATKDVYGDITSCKMHDLVHDFAISISKSEILILEGDFVGNVSNVQRLFVRSDGKRRPGASFSGNGFIKMRTLISENLDFDDMLSNFKCLRVLKLSGHSITGLSNSIEQLIHLRLLHILHTKIEELPKSVTKLYNLQTLRIEECPNLKKLPEDLSNLIYLRHISINIGCLIRSLCRDSLKNMGRLTCLQTLNFFGVGRDDGYRIKEMGPLKNLRGEINIYNLEMVKDEEEAKSAKLKEKEIFKLGLFWNNFRGDGYAIDEKVLEGLHPHPNLIRLTIEGYGGKKFPSWVNDLSLFHNLIHVELNWCMECEEVPTLGLLPSLRVLVINEMGNVRIIGSELYFYSDWSYRNNTTLFPALKILKLVRMHGLEEWRDAKKLTSAGEVLMVFPSLEELTLLECPNLRSLPGVPSVIRHLDIKQCGIDELPSGLQFCASLQYLKIEKCQLLKSIPDLGELFHSLINLKLSNSPYSQRLKLLRREDHLKTLVIKMLDAFLILHYPFIQYSHVSLKKLALHGSPTLNSLPDKIRLFTALEELFIENFNGMEALPDWLGNLSSLQKLFLYDCNKLMFLPILDLTNLKHLHIVHCPNLEKRCADGSSAEWFKIACIPNIVINGKYIKRKDSEDHYRSDFDDFEDD